MKASTCTDSFIANWVAPLACRPQLRDGQGCPVHLCSVDGCQHQPVHQLKHILTTAYHPQSNGMVERVHRQIKDNLRARGAGSTWHSHLPWVLMGLCAAPKEDSAVSSGELVNGSPLILLGQLLHDQILHVSTATHEAGVLCGSRQHAACTPGPAEASGGPTCRLLLGGLQGG
jgi:transposase InsO family protein